MTAELQSLVDSAGIFAPLLFLIAYIVLTVLFFPGSIVTVIGGALFGPVWGSILVVAGATAGASAAFLIARKVGRRRVSDRLGPRLTAFDRRVSRTGFLSVLAIRLVPLVPFNVSNYAFGVTGVRARSYVPATAIGIIPGTVVYVVLGSSLSDPTSAGFILSLAAAILLAVLVPLVDRRRQRRTKIDGGMSGEGLS